MEYERLAKGYHHGLQKIYEMVINNDPCYAYLMKIERPGGPEAGDGPRLRPLRLLQEQLSGSAKTSRKMMDEMANHGNRIRRYMDEVGVEEVEEFIDACLSIEDLIDIHSPFIRRREDASRYDFYEAAEARRGRANAAAAVPGQGLHGLVHQSAGTAGGRSAEEQEAARREAKPFPERPERDVMLFLLEHAPLNAWQADVLSIIRDEAYYFAPQAQTKIMNEGWASYWHSTIMTRQGLTAGDVINYCDHHSGTLASSPTQLNPYKLGIELFRDIEDRWNRGAFGKEYDDCDDYATPPRLEHRRRPGPREDLRSPPHSQRSDVHRRVPDARFRPRAQAVQVRLQREHRILRDRKPRVSARSSSSCWPA